MEAPDSALNSVLLPTLGRPTMPMERPMGRAIYTKGAQPRRTISDLQVALTSVPYSGQQFPRSAVGTSGAVRGSLACFSLPRLRNGRRPARPEVRRAHAGQG